MEEGIADCIHLIRLINNRIHRWLRNPWQALFLGAGQHCVLHYSCWCPLLLWLSSYSYAVHVRLCLCLIYLSLLRAVALLGTAFVITDDEYRGFVFVCSVLFCVLFCFVLFCFVLF